MALIFQLKIDARVTRSVDDTRRVATEVLGAAEDMLRQSSQLRVQVQEFLRDDPRRPTDRH